jgi:hypothetical protein
VNIIRLPFWILLAAYVLGSGCTAPKPALDPLAGWKGMGSMTWNGLKTPGERPPPLPEAIIDDYQGYIKKLPMHKGHFVDRSESYFIDRVSFFEDGTGKHAVQIRIPLDGVEWEHVLIYDKDNKRINATKYASGKYAS